jgi:hypothetical protein
MLSEEVYQQRLRRDAKDDIEALIDILEGLAVQAIRSHPCKDAKKKLIAAQELLGRVRLMVQEL